MKLIDPVILLVATYICKVTLFDPSLTVEAMFTFTTPQVNDVSHTEGKFQSAKK